MACTLVGQQQTSKTVDLKKLANEFHSSLGQQGAYSSLVRLSRNLFREALTPVSIPYHAVSPAFSYYKNRFKRFKLVSLRSFNDDRRLREGCWRE